MTTAPIKEQAPHDQAYGPVARHDSGPELARRFADFGTLAQGGNSASEVAEGMLLAAMTALRQAFGNNQAAMRLRAAAQVVERGGR